MFLRGYSSLTAVANCCQGGRASSRRMRVLRRTLCRASRGAGPRLHALVRRWLAPHLPVHSERCPHPTQTTGVQCCARSSPAERQHKREAVRGALFGRQATDLGWLHLKCKSKKDRDLHLEHLSESQLMAFHRLLLKLESSSGWIELRGEFGHPADDLKHQPDVEPRFIFQLVFEDVPVTVL